MIARLKGLKRKRPADSQAAPTAIPKQYLLPVSATISYGGWNPRTAMHMEEVYTFLSKGTSHLPLSPDKLASLHQALDLQSVAKEAGYLEYVRATTNSNIDIRYFEDGLFLLEVSSKNPELSSHALKKYHDEAFVPALNFLFSLDTPIPAIGRTGAYEHPVVVALSWPDPRHFEIDAAFGVVQSQITSDDVTVYKTPSHIFIVSAKRGLASIRDMVEMQIFFREFQARLEQFLNTQRKSWTELSSIYNREHLKPAELPHLQRLLIRQQKVAALSHGRLEQMDAYIQTRSAIAEQLDLSNHLLLLFHYRFEALEDSFHYLVRNWEMTKQYAQQTSDMLSGLQARAIYNVISSQRLAIVVLVVSSLAAWLTATHTLELNFQQITTLLMVLIAGVLLGWVGSLILKHSEYRIGQALKKPTKKQKVA